MTGKMKSSALVFFAILLACAAIPGQAVDFATTNVDALPHFWAAVESRQRPVTVVSFGDSMADSYRSPTCHLMNKLVARFGVSGYSLNNYRNTGGTVITNGASFVGPDGMWFNRYVSVPPGGATWWFNDTNPGGNNCDRAGIFYVAHPRGGMWRMMISTNGGPWGTVMTIDGASASPTGGLAVVDLPPNRYRVKAETDTGTNFFIGPYMLNHQAYGIHAVFMDWPGIGLDQVTNVPVAIRNPIFSALQPDLLVWHMKEVEDNRTIPRMQECESAWQTSMPNCDVLYIGTTWVFNDTNTLTLDQNTIVKNIALQYNRAYADLMQPTTSYSWLQTNGFMADEVHLNSAGGLYCANIMWDDLGFFALGLDRRISLQPNGPQLQLSYTTTTNARYRLEISPDLQAWTPLWTNPVANAVFSTNLAPGTGPAFYRLGLTPP